MNRFLPRMLARLIAGAAVACAASISRAEYYSFDVPSGADIVSQEVRWPVWAESTYNAVWTNDIISADKTRVYFYGGVPEANPQNPVDHPANIIWSFWPVSHPVNPGETVKVAWGNPQMYAPLAVGEGASGKASGEWPQLKTKQWYQFVLRVWQPIDNKAGHAFAAQWLHDPTDGKWYHVATMEIPFKAIGTSGMSGFIEDFSHGNRNPRRTEFRHAYYHLPESTDWKAAKNFTPSVRQHGEKGTVDTIENGTACFFETCSGVDYRGNLDYDNKIPKKTVTINEPDQPEFVAPTIESAAAESTGKQVLVTWSIGATASPQFAWKIEGLNPDGAVVTSAEARDPDGRQALLDTGSSRVAKVRLAVTDIFDRTVQSQVLPVKPVQLHPANTASNVKPGLNFMYTQAGGGDDATWNHLPDFTAVKPLLTGSTNGIDMTVRRKRIKYAIDFSGYLKVPTDGIYTFRLNSYDGSKLIIDGTTIIDNDGIHSYTDKSGNAALAKGAHPIEIEYFRDTDRGEHCTYADRMNLEWAGPQISLQPIPQKAFLAKTESGEPTISLYTNKGVLAFDNTAVSMNLNIKPGTSPIDRVAWYVDDMLWESRESAPWSVPMVLPAGTFQLHARVFTKSGEAFDTLPVTLISSQTKTIPWQVVQIGTPPPRRPLGAAVKGTDSIQLVGDGNGIACQQVNGDVELTAHVAKRPDHQHGTQDDGTTPDGDWSGGLLFRPDLTAHDTFLGDQFVAAYARVDQSTHLQCQKDHNGGGPVAGPDLGHYDWIKLKRIGDTFTASFSNDGKTWIDGGTRTVNLPAKLFAGVFIYSTAGYNPDINNWQFDHVTIAPAH